MNQGEVRKTPINNMGVTSDLWVSNQIGQSGKVTDVGVDWLTCTSDRDEVGLSWFEAFQRWAVEPRDWKNPWYEGKADEHIRWGYNPGIGYIFIASGALAAVVFQQTVPIAKKITRIDVQVTVKLPEANQELAQSAYVDNSESTFRKYGLVQTSRGGQTLYVGGRTSAQFGRLYDKGAESSVAPPGFLWRYEVELKKPVSDSVARQLASWDKKSGNEVHAAIVPFVFDWFFYRGVGPVFSREGTNRIVTEVGRRVTSDEKKLEWLKTGVRPTIQYLLGKGKAELLSEALGCKVEQLHVFDK